jgi:hypothetical protein
MQCNRWLYSVSKSAVSQFLKYNIIIHETQDKYSLSTIRVRACISKRIKQPLIVEGSKTHLLIVAINLEIGNYLAILHMKCMHFFRFFKLFI